MLPLDLRGELGPSSCGRGRWQPTPHGVVLGLCTTWPEEVRHPDWYRCGEEMINELSSSSCDLLSLCSGTTPRQTLHKAFLSLTANNSGISNPL